MKVEFLTLPNGKSPAEEFFGELDDKLIERLETEGKLLFPHARKLEGYKGLWEMRILSQSGAVRVFYVYWERDTILLVSGFMKKSQKTPTRELDRAVGYLKQGGVKL